MTPKLTVKVALKKKGDLDLPNNRWTMNISISQNRSPKQIILCGNPIQKQAPNKNINYNWISQLSLV